MSVAKLTAQHWGVGVVETHGERVVAVRGHPDDPDPSPIHGNLAASLAGGARVLRPSVRRGWLAARGTRAATRCSGDTPRGEDSFVEVSWDEALDLVADALRETYARHGSAGVFGGSYGWASAGRLHHAQSQLKRFLAAAGGFVRSEGNYSYHAALRLMPHIVGNFRAHVKAATRWRSVERHGQLVVMFGGVPLANTQVSGGGVARHALRDDLAACAHAGVRFVNVSPLRDDAAEALDAEWLAPRPGSDTALMLGLAHTLLADGLQDTAFLERYCVGFERVAAYLRGDDDGVTKSAEWAAALTEIPAERIRSLAREMAASRTLLTTAVSLQRADHGEQPLWATVTLAAMLGQIGLPGGGYGIGYGADAAIGTVDRPLAWPSFPALANSEPETIPVAAIADMLLHPGEAYEYDGEQRCYPHARLVWWAGGNPFHHHQDLNRLHRAFQTPETSIVNEVNWTATARHADIVLPVAASLEREDFGAGTQDRSLVPMPRAVAPPCEARVEYDIYRALEQRLSLGERFSLGRSAREWLEAMWGDMRASARTAGRELPELDAFLAGDVVSFDDPAPEAVFLAEFRADPEVNALPTPSGRIELYSARIAGFGYDDCPGHAVWRAPREWLGASLAERYPLHLLSAQPRCRLHSQYDNGDYSLAQKVRGREPIHLHPDDAARRGIEPGDIVEVFNDRGACLAGAVIDGGVREGVVVLRTGAWYDPDFEHPRRRDRHGNPNVLTHDLRTSRLAQGPAAQSTLVELRRFDGEPPPVAVFESPPRAGAAGDR